MKLTALKEHVEEKNLTRLILFKYFHHLLCIIKVHARLYDHGGSVHSSYERSDTDNICVMQRLR